MDLLTYTINLENQPPATFELVSTEKSVILMAPSDLEVEEWVHTLRKDMHKIQSEVMRKSVHFQQVRHTIVSQPAYGALTHVRTHTPRSCS